MTHKTKSFHSRFKADPERGIIEAFVSVYGVRDSYDEIVDFGAFTDSLANKLPTGVWMHDWTKPIARTLEAREVPPGDSSLPEEIAEYGGLYIKGHFNMATQDGRDAFSNIEFGLIDEFSIGYSEVEVIGASHAEDGVRHLVKLQLHEWSPVLRGANPMTQLVSLKSLRAETTDVLARVASLKTRFLARAEERKSNGRELSDEQVNAIKTLIQDLEAIANSPQADDARSVDEQHVAKTNLKPDDVQLLLNIRKRLEARQS
jgi:HK97 family phage prohead protease